MARRPTLMEVSPDGQQSWAGVGGHWEVRDHQRNGRAGYQASDSALISFHVLVS